MQALLYCLFILVITLADQVTKYLTVANIRLYQDVDFIPGILNLTYVQNTGAAFSALEGMRWLFVALFAVLTVVLVVAFGMKVRVVKA